MGASYGRKTTTNLIDSIKKRAAVPLSQNTYDEDDILNFANEEMDNVLIPTILKCKEEYYVITEELPLTVNATGFTRVSIPYRAIGNKIRNLYLESDQGGRRNMTRIQPEDIADFQYGTYGGSKAAFYLEGDDIVLVNSTGIGENDSLMISYYLRPNDLVVESRVPSITVMDTPDLLNDTINIYLTSLPDHFEIGQTVDFIEEEATHRIIGYDIPILDVNDNVGGTVRITVTNSLIPTGLKITDHVAISGETKVPQLPSDMHAMLAQATACRVLEAQGETTILDRAEKTLKVMLENALTFIDNRSESTPQKVLNSGGFLKRRRYIP